MQYANATLQTQFEVLIGNPRAQAAVMVLAAGESTGAPRNEHAGSDQWLYVITGEGEAVVNQQTVKLTQGSLLLVEQGEPHAISNTGSLPLQTINIYLPPAYRADGELIAK